MKKILYLPLLLFFVACGGNDTETETLPATEISLWDADMDSVGNLVMEKRLTPELDTLSVNTILSHINSSNPTIVLEQVRVTADTLFLRITDAHYLTQQMGSSGPDVYIAEVVYNFTELPGIRFVHLDFEEGDHAQPGLFKREDFEVSIRPAAENPQP